MDNKFTEQIKEWLDTPESERDYMAGAMMLLRLSGNKIMYRNIVANIDGRRDVVEHQLQKYYNFRVANMTRVQVKEMSEQVEKIAAEHELDSDKEPKAIGKRDDHDSLPDNIKACFVENLGILRRMRELHLQLRKLSLDNVTCPDSERYPFLKELIALDKKLHENWETYDSYKATAKKTTRKKTK